MPLPSTFNRGSEWLRWEPHIHAPGTVLEDRFGDDWNGYFAAIEVATPAVVALGVTDYMSIGCYEEFLKRRRDRAPGVKLVFANVEFRLSPFTSEDKAINAHLLVSPDDPDHTEKIKYALGNLQFGADGGPYRCDRAGLVALGRRGGGKIDEAAAFRRGVGQFTPSFEKFKEWLEGQEWLRKHSIVVFDGTGDDGVSGVRGARWASLREDICRFPDAIFSSNEGDRKFWLGGKGLKEMRRLNGPKPCLHGCDAHGTDRVCKPDQNRYTWIRANPTFEGLRQTIFEPADRVWIGERPPDERAAHRVASDVHFSGCDHWLKNGSIPINPGLVAIIGPRGSGKTALADSIAAATGAAEAGPASFVGKAADQLDASSVTLAWADGSKSQPILIREASREPFPAVRYLSQQFVERLCSDDEHADDEFSIDEQGSPGLLEEIESVVFSRLEDADATFASSFVELRNAKCEPFDAAIRDLAQEMGELTRRIHTVNASSAQQPARREVLKKINGEVAALEGHSAKLAGPENPAVLRQVQELQAKKTELQTRIATLRARDQDLENLGLEYERRARELSAFHEDAKRRLTLGGATQAETASLQPRFSADPQALISRLRSAIQKDADALVGPGTPPPNGTAAYFQLRIDELQKSIKADVVRKEKLAETTKAIGVKKAEAARVERELNEADENAKLIPKLLSRRFDAYLEVFDNLQKKKEALSALYAPLRAHLEEHGTTGERDLDFFVRTRVRLAKWVGEGQALLDGRKCSKNVEELAKTHLLQPWISGDRERISKGIHALYDEFRDVRGQLKTGVTVQSFGEWMFSADHILLQYGLKFDGTDLDHLSPGAKGVALLLLYLSIDKSDERPLIIDQPEENLDPKSVYEILVPHIKAARRRRQVIIVTHNPNLVVNTDADQVIVADSFRRERGKLPEISYACGALEDEQIRKAVCEILEGGADAFRRREAKYRLDEDDGSVQ